MDALLFPVALVAASLLAGWLLWGLLKKAAALGFYALAAAALYYLLAAAL